MVHELGHLIVMLSASSTIENFSILTAHVTATGGNYTKAGELWLQANVFSQDYHPLVVSASAVIIIGISIVIIVKKDIIWTVIKIVKEK